MNASSAPVLPTDQGERQSEEEEPLNLSLVHQAAIPGIWNQVYLQSFPSSWVVLGLVNPPPLEIPKLEIIGYGDGGIDGVVKELRPDADILFCGFRVAVFSDEQDKPTTPMPRFIFLRWLGRNHRKSCADSELEMRFMSKYFHHSVPLTISSAEASKHGDIGAFLRERTTVALQETEPTRTWASLDFLNRDLPDQCIHYDAMGKCSDISELKLPLAPGLNGQLPLAPPPPATNPPRSVSPQRRDGSMESDKMEVSSSVDKCRSVESCMDDRKLEVEESKQRLLQLESQRLQLEEKLDHSRMFDNLESAREKHDELLKKRLILAKRQRASARAE